MEKTLIPLTNAVLACVDNTDKPIISVCCQPMFYQLMVYSKKSDESFLFLETISDVARFMILKLGVSCERIKMIPDLAAVHKCPAVEAEDIGAFINSYTTPEGGLEDRKQLSYSMYGKADTILTLGTNAECFKGEIWEKFKEYYPFVAVCDIGIGYTFVSNTFSLKGYLHGLSQEVH